MSSSEPSKWTTALGASADVNVIPATTPAGTGLASMSSLFPAITQVPIDAGGIAPERADFNALFKMLGDQSYFLQQGGVYSYSASYPYRVGDLVMHGGSLYLCIASNGPGSAIKYPTDTAYWRQLALTSQLPTVNNGTLTIQKDGATVATFTANQAGNTIANIAISEIDSQSVSGPNGWVRFKSGVQIVFGSGSKHELVNFPVAFIAEPRLQLTCPRHDISGGSFIMVPGWYDRTTTYFRADTYDAVNNTWQTPGNFDFIAIGFWK